jgi:transcriptional regulator with XRE-family HTH domain
MMLGDRLKLLRSEKKLTQQEMSEKIGIERSRYSHYENDRVEPDTTTLRKLAEVHKVSLDFILGLTEDRNSSYLGAPTDDEIHEMKSLYDAMQEDPDDEFFVDGYLKATEEEKKMMRKFWRDHIWKKRK